MRQRDEWAGAATAAAAGIAGLAALCIAKPDAPLVSAVGQLLPYVGLALLGPALVLAALRRWRRAVGTALVSLGILALVAWRFASVSAGPATATAAEGEGTLFTLVSFNALYDNADGVSAVPFLVDSGADAVLILEAQQFRNELARLAAVYPYRLGCGEGEPCDTLLLSRHPPLRARQTWLGAVPAKRYVQFAFDLGGREVTLVGAHLTKPYFDELPNIERLVLGNRLRAIQGPLILAGDFNAVQWSPALAELATRGGVAFSGFFVPTWPAKAGRFGLPIDHVLTRGADIVSLEPLPSAFGSNHRGLVARIRIP